MPYSFDEFVAIVSKTYVKKQQRYHESHAALSSWMDSTTDYPTLEQYEEMYRNYLRSFKRTV